MFNIVSIEDRLLSLISNVISIEEFSKYLDLLRMVPDNSLSLKSNEFSIEILSKASGIEPLNLLPCKFICRKEFPLKQEGNNPEKEL
uniref:Uncharacterized protein n=1 Tax=Manihot esculenta TaxID=3983 RepID=A0A2C9V0N6_MANES